MSFKIKIYYLAPLIAITLVLGVSFYSSFSKKKEGVKSNLPIVKLDESILREITLFSSRIAQSEKIAQSSRAVNNSPEIENTVESLSYKKLIERLYKNESNVNRRFYLRAAAESLLDDREAQAIIKNNILLFSESKNFFGDDHAAARAMAIDLIAELANMGNSDLLIDVHNQLLQFKINKAPFSDQQDLDRIELLRAYFAMDEKRVLYDLPGMLTEIGYDESLRGYYLSYLSVWLQHSFTQKELHEALSYLNS